MQDVSEQTVHTQNEGPKVFQGRLLGFGSSRLETHIHPPSDPPGPGVRCSGCRWIETRVYWSETDQLYVVEVLGVSSLSGEKNRARSWWTPVGSLVDVLLVETPARRRPVLSPDQKELPQANREALEAAAENDPEVDRILSEYEDHEASLGASALGSDFRP